MREGGRYSPDTPFKEASVWSVTQVTAIIWTWAAPGLVVVGWRFEQRSPMRDHILVGPFWGRRMGAGQEGAPRPLRKSGESPGWP